MRWASFIFTFIIMIQAFWPCSDNLLPHAHAASYAQCAHPEQKKETGSDQCGPLCTCSCCATPTIVQLTANFAFTLSMMTPVYSEYTPAEFGGIAMTIWQPPRFNA